MKTAGKEEVLFLALLAVIRTPLRDESCLQYPPADEGWNLASVYPEGKPFTISTKAPSELESTLEKNPIPILFVFLNPEHLL